MALSKALQAKTWWETLNGISGVGKIVRANLPGRARRERQFRNGRRDQSQPQSSSPRLQQTLKDHMQGHGSRGIPSGPA